MRLTVICTLLFAPLAFADQASKSVKIEQLFQAMHLEDQQKQMMGQMQDMVISQVKAALPSQADQAKAEEMQKKLFALIGEEISFEKMKPVMIKAYSETYTEPEIDGIMTFYKSPPGKAMVEKQPMLMKQIMTGMQAQMSEIMAKIQKLMQP